MRSIIGFGAVAVWAAAALCIIFSPAQFWWWIGGSLIFSIGIISLTRHIRAGEWYRVMPWLMGAHAALVFLLFIDRARLRDIWLGIIGIGSVLYWYALDTRTRERLRDQECARLGIIWLALAVWFLGTALYGWQVFQGLSAWAAVLVESGSVAFATWTLWRTGEESSLSEALLHTGVITIVAAEFFWVVGFLTFGFMSKGLVWASGVWYLWWILRVPAPTPEHRPRVLKGTTFLFALWIIIFLTTRWF